MALQKRSEYGFNGYQVPPTPRAARSATRRAPFWKKTDDNNNNRNNKLMCAFDLLATVAGKLLQEGGDKSSGEEPEIKTEQETVENDPSNVNNVCDQGSSNRSFFVSEIISQAPVIQDSYSSGITVSDYPRKSKVVLSADKVKVKVPFSCKIDEKNSKSVTNEAPKPLSVVHSIDNNNVNLVDRDNDDDENSFGVIRTPDKNLRSPPRVGDRRTRRFLASKYWKTAPKLNDDEVHCNDDGHHNRKPCFKRQRSLKDYPLKKRQLYEPDDFSNSDVINSEDRPNTPQRDSIKDGSDLSVKSVGVTKTSGFVSKHNPAFHQRDSHVKLKIRSFRVPELFFELPKTTTVGSLKMTVMEALTSMLSGEVHVGLMLQGKRIRDDDKTLQQTGLHHKLDLLGFTLEPGLEPNQDQSFPPTPDMPKPSIRYTPAPNVSNQLLVQREVSHTLQDPLMTSFGGSVESEHDSAPSPPHLSLGNKSGSDSRDLVMVPRALTVVPLRKCKRSEVAQRRIRRPFSVSEVEALVQAVEKLGTGRWRDVKLRAFDNAKHRTYVDLKDKWKTLVHTARISPQQRRGEPVPQELLDRVLAAHAYWSHHQAKQQFKHPQPATCRLL